MRGKCSSNGWSLLPLPIRSTRCYDGLLLATVCGKTNIAGCKPTEMLDSRPTAASAFHSVPNQRCVLGARGLSRATSDQTGEKAMTKANQNAKFEKLEKLTSEFIELNRPKVWKFEPQFAVNLLFNEQQEEFHCPTILAL